MPRNTRAKPRLHLALYVRPKYPNTYHYALLVCPKDAVSRTTLAFTVAKHHAKNTFQNIHDTLSRPWVYGAEINDLSFEQRTLTRVTIGNILLPLELVKELQQGVPIYQTDDPSGKAEDFGCVVWVRLAIQELKKAGAAVENSSTWDAIQEEEASLRYIGCKKMEERWEVG